MGPTMGNKLQIYLVRTSFENTIINGKIAQIDPKINRSFVYYPLQMEIPGSREVPSPCVQTLTYTAQHRDNVERTNYENTWTVVDGMYPHCKMYIYIWNNEDLYI